MPAVPGSVPKDSTVVFVLGGPGTGKGTQCDRIKTRYPGVVHLSAGDLLRDEVKSGSYVGTKCAELMKEGQLVPMSVTITLLKNAMILSKGKFFLVDGFPRALDQAVAFEKGIMPCKTVLFFDCPEVRAEGAHGGGGLGASSRRQRDGGGKTAGRWAIEAGRRARVRLNCRGAIRACVQGRVRWWGGLGARHRQQRAAAG